MAGCPTLPQYSWEGRQVGAELKEDIWRSLVEADEQGFSITCETSGEDKVTESGGAKGSGIVSGHAYSLLRVAEHQGVRLLNIRNPWGRFEWDGDWSDGSELWTEDFVDALKPTLDESDGAFWVCLEDFVAKFTAFNTLQVKPWEEMRLKGKFIRVREADNEELGIGNQDWVISKFHYRIQVSEACNICLTIHQEDQRQEGADKRP
jgi:calpain-15